MYFVMSNSATLRLFSLVATFMTVNPEEKSGIHTVECNEDLSPVPVGRNIKIPSVTADRISFFISGVISAECSSLFGKSLLKV